MTFVLETMDFVAENGHILHITKRMEKFSKVAVWRVCFSYDGFMFYVLKDGLKNKPSKRQIENYLAQI